MIGTPSMFSAWPRWPSAGVARPRGVSASFRDCYPHLNDAEFQEQALKPFLGELDAHGIRRSLDEFWAPAVGVNPLGDHLLDGEDRQLNRHAVPGDIGIAPEGEDHPRRRAVDLDVDIARAGHERAVLSVIGHGLISFGDWIKSLGEIVARGKRGQP